MIERKLERWPLALSLLFFMLLDYVFTLLGQPTGAWNGSGEVNEANPIGAYLLSIHPLVFLVTGLVWCYVVIEIVFRSNRWIALYASLALCLGHIYGLTTWLNAYLEANGISPVSFAELYAIPLTLLIGFAWFRPKKINHDANARQVDSADSCDTADL